MLLEDITVIELFPNLATAYATRLLSDLGATVIMLEPSSGSDIRHMEPKFSGRSDEEIAKLRADGITFDRPLNTVLFPIEPKSYKK